MSHPESNKLAFEKLRNDILHMQGFKPASLGERSDFGLGPIEAAFPNSTFPTGAIHEFISDTLPNAAATTGFMATLLRTLMKTTGVCIWISAKRMIFPPGLVTFGVEPGRIIFIDIENENDLLWAIEESLKCDAVAAVIGEIREISLAESRRLQLAVERSQVTGLIHRVNPKTRNTLACVSRWQVTAMPSQLEDGMPGVGYPRWNVKLLKVRNGEPGEWEVEWAAGQFSYFGQPAASVYTKIIAGRSSKRA